MIFDRYNIILPKCSDFGGIQSVTGAVEVQVEAGLVVGSVNKIHGRKLNVSIPATDRVGPAITPWYCTHGIGHPYNSAFMNKGSFSALVRRHEYGNTSKNETGGVVRIELRSYELRSYEV
jgi:hypothetical protein